jgi:ABC-2 type transport system ATP-binding protein
VGYAPSNLQSFYPRLSATRNLMFFAALYGMTGPRAHRRVEALLERLGLTAAAAMPYERYSDGMKARLVLARALLHDPAVVLLDEPTRSIDATFRDELRSLWRLCDDGRARTALWATHDRAELRHADRVVRLAGGRLQDASVPHGLTRADEEQPLTAHAVGRLASAAS